jgi:hypothetical protein
VSCTPRAAYAATTGKKGTLKVRFKMPREFYIPKGSTKIADPLSDAVAYLYPVRSEKNTGATIFYGKQAKPVTNYIYRDAARRDAAVASAFERRRKWLAFKAERRAERVAFVPTYKVGDLFRTCWGYDQTNVEYFEVVEVKGKHVIVREIAQKTIQTGHDQGTTVPLPGQFLSPRYEGDGRGVPLRRLAQKGGIKIDAVRSASFCKPELVAGVPVYSPAYYSWGH